MVPGTSVLEQVVEAQHLYKQHKYRALVVGAEALEQIGEWHFRSNRVVTVAFQTSARVEASCRVDLVRSGAYRKICSTIIAAGRAGPWAPWVGRGGVGTPPLATLRTFLDISISTCATIKTSV